MAKKEKITGEPSIKKSLTKRWWFWAIIVVLAVGIIGNLNGNDSDDKDDSANAKSEKVDSSSKSDDSEDEDTDDYSDTDESESPDDSEEKTVEVSTGYFGNADVEDIAVSGSGNNISNKFSLKSGFAIITAKNTGSSNFIVDMKNGDGTDFNSGLVNEIGNFSGTMYVDIPTDGDYLFNVESDGAWSFTISQRVKEDSVNDTMQASGSGQQVIFMSLPEDGSYKLTATNTGDSNFIVSNGEDNTLINEIGNYSGSQVQSIDKGTYAISINSNGNWTLKFEEM